jgi:hypothetical protein
MLGATGPDGVVGAVIAAQRLIVEEQDTASRMANPLVVAILLMAFTQNLYLQLCQAGS